MQRHPCATYKPIPSLQPSEAYFEQRQPQLRCLQRTEFVTDTDSDTYRHGHTDSDGNGNCDGHSHADCYCYSYSDRYAYVDTDPYFNAQPDANVQNCPNTEASSDSGASPVGAAACLRLVGARPTAADTARGVISRASAFIND